MNSSAYTVDLLDRGSMIQIPATGFWRENPERPPENGFDLSGIAPLIERSFMTTFHTATAMADPWRLEQLRRDAVITVRTAAKRMLIHDLGWSREQALETRLRLRTFEEDWNAPGMESYDEL